MSDPISNKVSNGGAAGIASAVIAAALQYYVPAFHSGIPQFVQLLITGGIGAVGYFGGGYLSKHQATVTEITTALDEIRQLETAIQAVKPKVVQP
jgi:hypothetical protein